MKTPRQFISRLRNSSVNQQTHQKSKKNAEHHYNLGNDLFFEFLGGYKNYSCGYFKNSETLEEAQLADGRWSLSTKTRILAAS